MGKAVLAESYQDKKDNNPLLFIHRLYAPFEFKGKLYRVKLTVKDDALQMVERGVEIFTL